MKNHYIFEHTKPPKALAIDDNSLMSELHLAPLGSIAVIYMRTLQGTSEQFIHLKTGRITTTSKQLKDAEGWTEIGILSSYAEVLPEEYRAFILVNQ